MIFKTGVVQLRSGTDMVQNFRNCAALIEEATKAGASFISTPEVTNIFEPDRERLKAVTVSERDDLSVHGFSALAEKLKITLHVGSMALKGDDGKLVNRTLLFGPDGQVLARYDKIHLFDVDLPTGEQYRESASYTPGDMAVMQPTAFANLGLAICYDMRFPVLFNTLARAGADVMLVPAAFTVPTGLAHWHVLLRARAIETGSFVIAAAQGGRHDSGRETFGHSLVVNPWGEVVAEAGDEPTVLVVDIDPAESIAARQRIPALKNARPFTLGHYPS
jgi:deaminated glutathione amidase